MSLNENRKQIVFVGRRGAGKSTLVNNFLGQTSNALNDIPDATTDPVRKTVELLPYGSVLLIDTAGIDDSGELGSKRISRTIKAISGADFAVVVVDATRTLSTEEYEVLNYLDKISVPFVIAANKIELGVNPDLLEEIRLLKAVHFEISCKLGVGIEPLKRKVIRSLPPDDDLPLVSDLVSKGDTVVLVLPSAQSSQYNRLMLPHVQTIREALEKDTIVLIVKDNELPAALASLRSKPDLIISDSQAVLSTAENIPDDIRITTFSLLMARQKGDLKTYIKGLRRIQELRDGDKILIAEACRHHSQEDDLGRIKIPEWLAQRTKKNLVIDFAQGSDLPENLSAYRLIIHCSACMLSRKMMQVRLNEARLLDVPVVNYGFILSYMNGAVPRALQPFGEAAHEWEKSIKKIYA